MQEIGLKVNQQRLFKNLKLVFSNRFTVLAEMMQNARRSGATYVDIVQDGDTLTVTDNGGGIADMQSLLTVAESGWDEELAARESAYGMGFLSALFACPETVVRSRGKMVRLFCDELITNAQTRVQTDPDDDGLTHIVLLGAKLKDLKYPLTKLAAGFPIEVRFNGESLPRPHALDTQDENGLHFVVTEIGQMSLYGIHHGNKGVYEDFVKMYYQGLPISEPHSPRHDFHVNVIHLDTAQFKARMPDRDALIDEDVQRKRIRQVIDDCWKDHLKQCLKEMTPEAFCDTYTSAAWRLDKPLFCDLPLLPRQFLNEISDYPTTNTTVHSYITAYGKNLTREQLKNKACFLVQEPDGICDAENIALWMYLREQKAVLLDRQLPEGHWAHEYIHDLSLAEITVNIINPGKKDRFFGLWTSGEIQLCDAVSIKVAGLEPTVLIVHDGFYDIGHGAFLIPKGETMGKAVLQVSDYEDEYDCHQEREEEEDFDSLTDFIRRLRCEDPAAMLADLLSRTDIRRHELLRGKAFTVAVDGKGELQVLAA